MKDSNYYQVQGWMVNQLKLKGNELICYAVIYSFSQDEESQYMGGVSYLQGWMNASKATVIDILAKLVDKGLIIKHEVITETCKRCYYSVGIKSIPTLGQDSIPTLGQDSIPNNNIYNNNKNKKRLSNDNQKAEGFDLFWETYDYKKGKVKAESAWKKLTKVQKEEAIKAIPLYKEDCKRNDRQMKHPATYLNQRTWEDDFTCNGKIKEEKEESTQEPVMSEAEVITWRNNQEWMEKKVPGLKDRINYDDFCEMRALAHFKSDVYADILMEIEKEGIIGNIVSEFDIRCQNAYYHRIWDNE